MADKDSTNDSSKERWWVQWLPMRKGRWAGWRKVIAEEGRQFSYRKALLLLAKPWRWRSEAEVERLMGICRRCKVFDPMLERCGPRDAPEVGCRCHCPTIARYGGSCWLREHGGNYGWD